MTFNYSFDEKYKEQKILNVDFGPVNIIEPKYYIYSSGNDSIWTKLPKYPILLDNFMENCVSCGGGIEMNELRKQKTLNVFFVLQSLCPTKLN